ncbi:hypothetical protein EON65_56980 [archaeon]|nr:MAG: hypothetical protein EON65_56980 [archaeon]
MSTNWLEELHEGVVSRNSQELDPYVHIYKAYTDMFHRYHVYEHSRSSLKHRIAKTEWEINDTLKDSSRKESVGEVAKRGFEKLRNELVHYSFLPSESAESLYNLNRIIVEQQKLVVNLQEEAKLAKDEHRQALDKVATLESQLKQFSGNSSGSVFSSSPNSSNV